MPRRSVGRKREEILSRWIKVESVGFSVYRRAEKPRGEPPRYDAQSYLEILGEADEPLGDVSRFVIQVNVDDSKEPGTSIPPATGAFIQMNRRPMVVVSLDSPSFDRLWALATANLLRYCHLAFTRPYRGSSLIVSASFSSKAEEEDELGSDSVPTS